MLLVLEVRVAVWIWKSGGQFGFGSLGASMELKARIWQACIALLADVRSRGLSVDIRANEELE